ncbi:hypothetical protein SS50377_22441 [Spironucleus salmonicida]|uniref:Uncharacterized protein n=1 Tax=Spironucleus salmonicida TaxID=348837 RepID=V6LCT8_9EUKA|nr:hypothetical protein SS50377_22441 [Spironucleus salmonicida]|eukprot:EST42068.1 Hypothetical protein SS50377_18375 [Spironucleus salmonicida]
MTFECSDQIRTVVKRINKLELPFLGCETVGDVIQRLTVNTASDITMLVDGQIVNNKTKLVNGQLATICSKAYYYAEFLNKFSSHENLQDINYFKDMIVKIILESCIKKGEKIDLINEIKQEDNNFLNLSAKFDDVTLKYSEIFSEDVQFEKIQSKLLLKRKIQQIQQKQCNLDKYQINDLFQNIK